MIENPRSAGGPALASSLVPPYIDSCPSPVPSRWLVRPCRRTISPCKWWDRILPTPTRRATPVKSSILRPAPARPTAPWSRAPALKSSPSPSRSAPSSQSQLNSANANQASADTLKGTYTQLENIVGALNSGSNLSSAMNQFFNSISDVLNQPGNESVMQSAVLQGQTLAQTINSMANQTVQLRTSIDSQISALAPQINSLTSQIAKLNMQISEITGGGQSPSDANGLSDQRNQAISSLSQLIGIQVNTQPDGSVSIYNGGNYLVDEGFLATGRRGRIDQSRDRGLHAPDRGDQFAAASDFRPVAGARQLARRRARRVPGPVEFLHRHADQRVQQDLFRRARDHGLHADREPQRR